MKKYLFVLRHLPNQGNHVQEALDLLLTTAAFDQHVAVLMLDDGVFQLKTGQHSAASGLRDTSAVFAALEIYGVNDIYMEAESLYDRGLTAADMLLPVKLLPRNEVNQFLQQYDILIPD